MTRIFLCLLLCLCLAPAGRAASVTVRDSRGQNITLPAPPKRIVSLSPGITEMLFALGLGPNVVGDTVYCDYPAAAKKITKIGDMNANYEKIVALRPDLVIGDAIANRMSLTGLGRLRTPLYVIQAESFHAVEITIADLGRLTGRVREAATIVKDMEAKRARAKKLRDKYFAGGPMQRNRRLAPRVLLVVDSHPLWAAGAGTFVYDILTEAGGTGAPASIRGYAAISAEAVLVDPPDMIMASAHDRAALRADPALSRLAAVRNNRFFGVSDGEMIVRPGPRLADALLEVARALYLPPPPGK
jgi:iron complex transport system substrate-binding protein